MARIRIGIIGLSASAKTSWASNAHLPYLNSREGKSRYEIVALCNSSVDAARAAISTCKLLPGTKAYGDPESLAQDPDIDLVVCCTRVDLHHETILPSVKAGKDVYVEWPLAQDDERVKELVDGAKQSGSRTMVGVQGRVAPPVLKLRELIQQGRIGKVLSSEIHASGGSGDREVLPTSIEYFTRSEIGGDIYTIGFGHLFDQVQHVLGELADVHPHLQLQRPQVKIRNLESQKIIKTVNSDVPDLILVAGYLAESEHSARNASVITRFRRGQPFPGKPALDCTINGEKGEIRLLAPGGTTLHATAYSQPVTIEVDDFESGKVEKVEWNWYDWQGELPLVSRSVGTLYNNFADGADVPTFGDAQTRHRQLNSMLSGWKQKA